MNEERLKKIKQAALRYTAYRERAPKEVIDKLHEWEALPEEIEQLLKELKEEGFIDEGRFANAFFHDKFLLNKWGKRRIVMEIKKYNLPCAVVERGLTYINQTKYEETLIHLAKSKWNKLKDVDPLKKKQKTTNFLMQKGYESDLIWKVIRELERSA